VVVLETAVATQKALVLETPHRLRDPELAHYLTFPYTRWQVAILHYNPDGNKITPEMQRFKSARSAQRSLSMHVAAPLRPLRGIRDAERRLWVFDVK